MKPIKSRFSLLLACNASGTCKLKPLLLHTARNPRAYKNIGADQRGVFWRSNKKAWMTGDLFQWEMERLALYLKKNHPGKRFGILMDNCSSHKRIEFENLEIIFFPPSTTGILQPLAIFALVKSKYRKWLAQQKLFGLSTTEEQAVKQFNSIYLNLTPKCVNHGWWKSGLQKFRHLKSDQE